MKWFQPSVTDPHCRVPMLDVPPSCLQQVPSTYARIGLRREGSS
jgi:hypothetical protein